MRAPGNRRNRSGEDARSVLADPKGWLLQGMCFCGQCGHVLKCMRKRPGGHGYYACRGRVSRNHVDSGKRCTLPYIRADKLEWPVWEKVRDILRNQETLAKCVNKALVELEEKKSQIGAGTLAIDNKLETIRAKKERLGLAFADGAVQENVYKSRLNQLKKQKAAVLKCRHNIDPIELVEMIALGIRIDMVKDVLSKGSLLVTDFGIFGELGDIYSPVGFNAFGEHDGELAIGEMPEKDTLRFEMTNMVMRATDAPTDFRECKDLREKREMIKRNQRATLQLFNIRVIVYPERVEIRGMIPTQILDKTNKEENQTAPIILPLTNHQGEGDTGDRVTTKQRAKLLLNSP